MSDNPPIKILLVDDKPANLLALEAVLEGSGYSLSRARSGAEAIKLVEKETFAVVMLDVQMPGLDGYETAKRIKRLPNGRDVPIMFVTAVYKEDEDVRRGYAAGGLDYFAKPLDPDLIRAKVQIYADLFRMTHATKQHETLLKALQEQRAAEKALDKLLQTVSEGVVIADAAGHITRTNDEAKWIWGGSKARELHGADDFLGWWVDSGKSVGREEWAMTKALKTGQVEMNEPIAIQCFDGRHKTILESASPLGDENGAIIGAVVVMKVIAAEQTAGLVRGHERSRAQRHLGGRAPSA